MTVETFILNIRNLDAKKLIIEAASLNLPELADLNTLNLSKGFLSNGERTDTYASPAYEQLKKSMGSKSVPYMDWKLTGAFYEGWYTEIKGDKIVFGSNDEKQMDIQRRAGDKIFGVTTEDLESQTDADLVSIIDKHLMK